MRDGFLSEIVLLTPRDKPERGAPLAVIYFGGGFIFGNNRQGANYAKAICRLCSAVVVLPSYRLAPEFPFPTGPNDAWDSFAWIDMHAKSLGADPTLGFVVGGRSAGATLSLVITQKSRLDPERYQGPRITGLWLSVPMLLTENIVPADEKHSWISREQNNNSPVFNTAMVGVLTATWQLDDRSPMFSPFNAGPKAHRGMPPTHLQVCGMDPLRDDALIYERVLGRNGVQTMMDVYPGIPHAVTTQYPELAAAKKYQIDVIDRVGQLLGLALDRRKIGEVFPW